MVCSDSCHWHSPDILARVMSLICQAQCPGPINYAYATVPDSAFDGTPEKQFDEEDGQSNDSQFHTPAPLSKRRRLPSPSVSPKKRSEDVVAKSDSDSFERDSLFYSPASRKRGCQCPRKPW